MKDQKIKNYCYAVKCGPIVKTGFHLQEYYVCRHCKVEVSESLAKRVLDKEERVKTQDEIDLEDYWNLGVWNGVDGDDL